jgi:hypothetical protein
MRVLKLGAGLAVGYVLGSRAGREKYEQIVTGVRRLTGGSGSSEPAGASASEGDVDVLTGGDAGPAAKSSARRATPKKTAPASSSPAAGTAPSGTTTSSSTPAGGTSTRGTGAGGTTAKEPGSDPTKGTRTGGTTRP